MRSKTEASLIMGLTLTATAGVLLYSSVTAGNLMMRQVSQVRRRIDDVRALNRLPMTEKLGRFRNGFAVLACRTDAVPSPLSDEQIRRGFETGACILKTKADLPPPTLKGRSHYLYFTSKGPS